MAKITTLTPAQEAQLPVVRDEWLTRGLATGPCDREEVLRGIGEVYSGALLEKPRIVIWLDSPLAGCIGSWMVRQLPAQVWDQVWDQVGDQVRAQVRDQVRAQVRDQVRAQVRDQVGNQVWAQVRAQVWDQVRDQVRAQVRDQVRAQVRDQVGNQVWAQVRAQVWDQVRDQVRDQVWDQVGDQVRDQVRDQVWDQVWAQVRAQVRDQVGDQVRAQVRDQVGAQVRDQVGNQVRAQVGAAGYGQHDASWIAWAKFCRDLGVKLPPTHDTWLEGMVDLAGGGWWWPMRGAVVITDRPNSLHRDAEGRLHNEGGMAIAYADGWGIWGIHGVRVTEQIVMHPETLTPKSIMAEPNTEVRRIAIERYGWERFVPDSGMKLIDKAPDPANAPHELSLYHAPRDLLGYEARVLLCTNASPERDGTVRRFGLTVPVDMPDALSAAGWTFGLSRRQYRQLERAS